MYCQALSNVSFSINRGESCTSILDKFKDRFDVLIAYSPTLSQNISTIDKVLNAPNVNDLFEKICNTFQLEYTEGGAKSYLVRSESKDIFNADDIILHIRLQDAKDNLPISYATVYDESRKYYGFTDEVGDCFIKIPKNKKGQKLTIHSLAYQEKYITIDTDNPFQEIKVNPDPVKVLPVTINTIKRKLSFSKSQALSIDRSLLEKVMAASVFQKDVMRTLQLMPGVSAINDSKSSIRIRGANEEATLLILDEMPVYKADHFFGIFGAFNSWYINDISLFKNNIPVQFGGRTSGLVKMESSKVIEPFKINVDINLLSSGIMASVPIGNNISFKVSGRTTYTDLIKSGFYDLSQRQNLETGNQPSNNNSQITSNPSFDFYDVNSKLIFKKNNHSFDINIFKSKDRFEDRYSLSFKNKLLVVNDELFSQISNWQNLTSGINYIFDDKDNEFKASIYSTSHTSNYDITSNFARKEKNEVIRDTIKIFNQNDIQDTGIKVSFRKKSLNSLIIGLEHIEHNNELYIENDKNPIFEINKKGRESSIFGQASFGEKSSWYAEPGIRITRLHDFSKAYFLPQLYISSAISEDLIFKASAGRQVQYVRLFEHENAIGQKQQFFALSNDSSVPIGIGTNFMTGLWKNFGKFTLDIEGYYKNLEGAIIHATQMPGLRPPQPGTINTGFLLFTGQSRSYGADISVVYEHKSYFSLLTYTISKTENKFKDLFKNQYFPSSEDSRHQFKWINTFSAGKFDFSANYIGATGRPYLDLSTIRTPLERINLDVNKYIKNLPAYHRIDAGVFYKIKIGSLDSRIGISVFNLTNRINVKYRQFVYQIPGQSGQQNPVNTILGSDVAQLERTYNVSFNITIR